MHYLSSVSITLLTALALTAANITLADIEPTQQFSINGVVEIEAFSTSQDVSAETADIVLATAEVSLQGRANDQVSVDIILFYEEGTSGVDVSEAFLTALLTDQVALSAGKMVLPFGDYASNMVSDPFTLALGETLDTAIQLQFIAQRLSASVYFFTGAVEESAAVDEEELRYGANIKYAGDIFSGGIHWISSLDSDALDEFDTTTVADTVAGAGVHAGWQLGPINLLMEHITAIGDYRSGDFGGDVSNPVQPSASTLEFAFIFEDESSIAISAQKTQDAAFIGLGKEVAQLAYVTQLVERVWLGIEYTETTDYAPSEGGANDHGSQILLQLTSDF